MANCQAESSKGEFEQEMLRLMRENIRLLQSIDDKIRKIVPNTNNIR